MAEYPAMPLWTDAYLADTRHLDRGEHGAYLLLLMEAWRRPNCSLPDDDKLLARMAACTPDEWQEIKPAIMAFWTLDKRAKEWRQKRQRKEREYVEETSRLQSHRARSGWEKRRLRDAAAMPEGMPDGCRNDAPIPIPIPRTQSGPSAPSESVGKKERSPSGDPKKETTFIASVKLAPEWVPTDALQGWLDFRRAIKAPVTKRVWDLLIRDLERVRQAGLDPGEALDYAVKRGWRGFSAAWIVRDMLPPVDGSNRRRTEADDRFADKMEMARRFDERTEGKRHVDHGAGGSAAQGLPASDREPRS